MRLRESVRTVSSFQPHFSIVYSVFHYEDIYLSKFKSQKCRKNDQKYM